MTPDVRVAVDANRRGEIINQVRSALRQYPQSDVDGVRVQFPGGWALVRGSVTEAKLTFRFEGDSPGRLDEIVREFCASIGDLGGQVLEQFEAAGRM